MPEDQAIATGDMVVDDYGRRGIVVGIVDDQADVEGYQRVWRVPLALLRRLPPEDQA